MDGGSEIGAFLVGVLLSVFFFFCFLTSCDELVSMERIMKGYVYEGKVYHAIVDSARTDSLHNWRK